MNLNRTNFSVKKIGVELSQIKFLLNQSNQIEINTKTEIHPFLLMPLRSLFLYFSINLISFFYKKFISTI